MIRPPCTDSISIRYTFYLFTKHSYLLGHLCQLLPQSFKVHLNLITLGRISVVAFFLFSIPCVAIFKKFDDQSFHCLQPVLKYFLKEKTFEIINILHFDFYCLSSLSVKAFIVPQWNNIHERLERKKKFRHLSGSG